MFKKINRFPELLFLISIIGITIFLRLYRLADLFHFTYDESVFAFVGKRMFVNHHIPLIGGVTPFHVHLAPYFYWLSGFFLYLSKLNPLGWGVVASILSGVTVLFIYLFTRLAYSRRVAVISAIFYAFSTYVNIFDRHYWGLFFNPLITIIVFYSLFKIINKKNNYFLLLASVLAFGFHTDPSTLVFFPLLIFTLYAYRISVFNQKVLFSLLIFLGSFLPLLVFDFRHDFVNIKGFGQYSGEIKQFWQPNLYQAINSLFYLPNFGAKIIFIPYRVDLAKEYSYCAPFVAERFYNLSKVISLLSGLLIISVACFQKNKKKNAQIASRLINFFLVSVFAAVFVYFGLLGGQFFEHYLTTLIVPLVIYFSLFIDWIINKQKLIGYTLFFVFIGVNIYRFSQLRHSFGFYNKSQAVKWAIENTKGEFSLESLSDCFRYNGYRYLFLLYGKEPSKSFVDKNFFWLYDRLPDSDHPAEVVVVAADDFVNNDKLINSYNFYKEREIKSQKFTGLEVIISDNTKGINYEF